MTSLGSGGVRAVVFDLLYTLVHPGKYPGGVGRIGWLADMIGLDPAVLMARWTAFEPLLESGQAPCGTDGLGPELAWVRTVTADFGVTVGDRDLDLISAGWDLTRRTALLDPPPSTIHTLAALREQGHRIGVLSNTHGLELRAWSDSPLARLVDVVGLSHQIGACKPEPAAYTHVLRQLDVPATAAAYVGDGSSDELLGARNTGFGMVILAEEAAATWAPDDLPRLRAQADASVTSLADVEALLNH